MTNYASYVNLLLRPNLISEIDKKLATGSLLEFIRQAWPILQPVEQVGEAMRAARTSL